MQESILQPCTKLLGFSPLISWIRETLWIKLQISRILSVLSTIEKQIERSIVNFPGTITTTGKAEKK